ncbi:hypothetical protein FOMPIDRAFT_89949 [Fomitopsis schrenkii]|uniref:Uncharacterized protein n=1 Tax=Fomitopsis schrenkii TaxID=2126942 RepID=S8E3K4_FOMSC|nr:hypothetical protein FOMPIDRAFT_89949 [Fomitopsis schrenkii]
MPMGELGELYGAAYIGVCVSMVFYGILNLQVYTYFMEYPHERWNNAAVLGVWVVDSLHSISCIHMVYWYLVTNYNNPSELSVIHRSFRAEVMLNGFVVTCVHA